MARNVSQSAVVKTADPAIPRPANATAQPAGRYARFCTIEYPAIHEFYIYKCNICHKGCGLRESMSGRFLGQ